MYKTYLQVQSMGALLIHTALQGRPEADLPETVADVS